MNVVRENAYNCLHCHSDIGHVYEDSASAAPAVAPVPTSTTTPPAPRTVQKTEPGAPAPEAGTASWYVADQAAAGAKLYGADCASCHGAKLEGGAGPGLAGSSWKQSFAGAKLLTIWGEIHGPMAQYAGTTFTEQQSLDILSFLLQQNGLPAGNPPLADTRQLSRRLPAK